MKEEKSYLHYLKKNYIIHFLCSDGEPENIVEMKPSTRLPPGMTREDVSLSLLSFIYVSFHPPLISNYQFFILFYRL